MLHVCKTCFSLCARLHLIVSELQTPSESENQKLCTTVHKILSGDTACPGMSDNEMKSIFPLILGYLARDSGMLGLCMLRLKVAEQRINRLRPRIGEKSSSHTYIFWHPAYTTVTYREKKGPSKSPVFLKYILCVIVIKFHNFCYILIWCFISNIFPKNNFPLFIVFELTNTPITILSLLFFLERDGIHIEEYKGI